MIGAILGDIVGSVYEFNNIKTKDFPLFSPKAQFTDDTVLTIATASALLADDWFTKSYQSFFLAYPGRGYGHHFMLWGNSEDPEPYDSWGNGSAMRVSPIGFSFETLEETLEIAASSAACTHNHPEGIKGAQATASAIFLARSGKSKEEIKTYIHATFAYDLDRTIDDIRPKYEYDVSCQGSVPEAIVSFLDSDSFEDCIRNAISLGGDSDTIACIAGGIAEAFYGLPEFLENEALTYLNDNMRSVVQEFHQRYSWKGGRS
jgi:ADP-ribosylglycohydrolase